MQTIIPKIYFTVITSPNEKKPINTNATAKQIFATKGALLTFHPARYAKIYPISSPTTITPSAKEVQFSFLSSAEKFKLTLPLMNIQNEKIAATIYVIPKEKMHLHHLESF